MAVVPNPAVRIVFQQEVSRLTPGGRQESRNLVQFLVGPDGPYTVEVPLDGMTTDSLWTAINAKADQILAVRMPPATA